MDSSDEASGSWLFVLIETFSLAMHGKACFPR